MPTSASKTSWIAPLDDAGGRPVRLICCPHAGGAANVFSSWPALLPDFVATFALALPGRGRRFTEAPVKDVATIVRAASLEALRLPPRPTVLFGHSLGASLAYEIAAALEDAGAGPALLIVSGRQAPGRPSRRRPIAGLPGKEFVAGLSAMGGTPPEVLSSPEMVDLLLPMLMADFWLAETYRPLTGRRLSCPVVACGGVDDPWIDAADLEAWAATTEGPFSTALFPGDHFYLREPDRLLARVSAVIADRFAARRVA